MICYLLGELKSLRDRNRLQMESRNRQLKSLPPSPKNPIRDRPLGRLRNHLANLLNRYHELPKRLRRLPKRKKVSALCCRNFKTNSRILGQSKSSLLFCLISQLFSAIKAHECNKVESSLKIKLNFLHDPYFARVKFNVIEEYFYMEKEFWSN